MPNLEELAGLIRVCPDCDLCQTRTQAVPGEGPGNAKVFLIGEGPGYYEDKTGRPFVGAAGKFLDELLGLAGLRRADVFITNVVKCRPPNNRDPLGPEIDACQTWLDQQLAAIAPSFVITLGRYSMSRYFPGESISRIHGQPRISNGLTVVPMYHPAAALHQQRFRSQTEDDFRRLPALLQQGGPVSQAEPKLQLQEPEAKRQMRLF